MEAGYRERDQLLNRGNEKHRFTNAGILMEDIFVAVEASDFNAFQHAATTEPQTVQSKASRIRAFQRISTSAGIWCGTRGSEVQILSPRLINSKRYSPFRLPPKRAICARGGSMLAPTAFGAEFL